MANESVDDGLKRLLPEFLEEFELCVKNMLNTRDLEVLSNALTEGIDKLHKITNAESESSNKVVSELFHRTLIYMTETIISYIKNSQKYRIAYSKSLLAKGIMQKYEEILKERCHMINLNEDNKE
ncbi:hypothetical protein UFOVP97_19 [uncultured Caudovirales phage]|uniref:Uncharacterized protein n=1 Tax=uncultured Caudovirales phage TaxID=2100421 RepID=A0A6J5LMP6_9CAUD|nr:hypothetical protein UFOVP97_19 [uncultured Caudovirales phage]CAB4134270.1 hypothetical protein UFOVP268_37 [uncultured Caudovirales phage]